MRINWDYIKLLLLAPLVVLLYAFTLSRNNARAIADTTITFKGDGNLFITHETVSKLLIQNQLGDKNVAKEILALNTLEAALNSNPMIKSAEVYMSVDGVLNAEIQQKKPIARVNASQSYYVDDEGKYMPLSANHTARVPLVTGNVNKNNLDNIFRIAKKIETDAFLKQHVVAIQQQSTGHIFLKLRQCDFMVNLGGLHLLDKKINNLKAFYKKSLKEKTLQTYSMVNLQFDNQVVCTKK